MLKRSYSLDHDTLFSWPLESIDIKFAFIQGDMATRTVHIHPPKEAATNKLCS